MPGASAVAAEVDHPATVWTDPAPDGGYYLVVAVDADGYVGGYSEMLGEVGTAVEGAGVPHRLAIEGAVPNPFNPRTVVRYAVPRAGRVTLRVHDLRGRSVRTLVDGDLAAGVHQTVWDGRDERHAPTAAGIYLLRLSQDGVARTSKLGLAK